MAGYRNSSAGVRLLLGTAAAAGTVGFAVVGGCGVASADDTGGDRAGSTSSAHSARNASSSTGPRAASAPRTVNRPTVARPARTLTAAPAVRSAAASATTSRVTVRSLLNNLLTWVSEQIPVGKRVDATKYADVSYGSDPAQKLDVYAPPQAADAPIIVMVHGGGWAIGDKSHLGLVANKVNHYLPEGYVFVSINYPMLPANKPDVQADSVAAAITYVQAHATEWGGDPNNIVVMGHSAGAHLIALVSAQRDRYPDLQPWRGTVVLDSGALDLVTLMQRNRLPLYTRAFGDDPAYWEAMSPLAALHEATEPILLVCSTQRRHSCTETATFADASQALGTDVTLLPKNLSHGQINKSLGRDSAYTDAVDEFIHTVTGVGTT
ncbi:Carboxylesterase type B [Mycolicibacterium rhodesiae JS60]|nr:Carboxylesterase type B [Mycolicibacterium rhodesiae JS60]